MVGYQTVVYHRREDAQNRQHYSVNDFSHREMKYVKIGEALPCHLASGHNITYEEIAGQSQNQENRVKYQENIG